MSDDVEVQVPGISQKELESAIEKFDAWVMSDGFTRRPTPVEMMIVVRAARCLVAIAAKMQSRKASRPTH